jgi:protoheme IX farnesyltransferase
MQVQSLATTRQLSDFISITKPRIAVLSVVTTLAGMWLAAPGMLPLDLVLFTVLGTALAAGAAGTLNNFLDRELDQKMERTAERPLPSGRIVPHEALAYGILLTASSFAILALFANFLTAFLALGAILFYAPVYTLWLKRKTAMCTVLGGITGAIPPVMGWTAVTGQIEPTAIVLFGILFFWQPPHFWALALLKVEDYRNAGIPMLPVVHGTEMTRRQILIYVVALIPISALLYATGVVNWIYLTLALVLGFGFVAAALYSMFDPANEAKTLKLFFYSMAYLAILCIAMFFGTIQ